MSDNVVKVYQERGDHGEVFWVADGPACVSSGASSKDEIIARYKKSAAMNGVDVESLTYEYGRWVTSWEKFT